MMSLSLAGWHRPAKIIVIVIAALTGLYLFAVVVAQMILENSLRGIASSKATALSAYNLYAPFPAADKLLDISGKNVVRAVTVSSEVPSFDLAAQSVQDITRQSNGFLEEFNVHRQSGSSPWLEAKLRLPAESLDSALAALRNLGIVKQESEASENTGAERESLSTQIESKRTEVGRLTNIVQHRMGSLPDTVQAEEKLAAHRRELDDLEKQFKRLEARVEYALVELQITEQYRARLGWHLAGFFSDMSNSLIDGLGILLGSLAVVLGFLLHYGLVTALWAGIVYWPSRSFWRRYRKSASSAQAA